MGDLQAEIHALLDAGITGFFSDHPDLAVRARDEWWADQDSEAVCMPQTVSSRDPAFHSHPSARARGFYGELFGCPEGRSSDEWVDFDFFGHQVVAHLDPGQEDSTCITTKSTGTTCPCRISAWCMEWDAWQALAERLRSARHALRDRARHPLRGPGGRAGDDVSLRPFRQRARVQGVQGSCRGCSRSSWPARVRAWRAAPRLTSFAVRRVAEILRVRRAAGAPGRRRSASSRPREQRARDRRRRAPRCRRCFP